MRNFLGELETGEIHEEIPATSPAFMKSPIAPILHGLGQIGGKGKVVSCCE